MYIIIILYCILPRWWFLLRMSPSEVGAGAGQRCGANCWAKSRISPSSQHDFIQGFSPPAARDGTTREPPKRNGFKDLWEAEPWWDKGKPLAFRMNWGMWGMCKCWTCGSFRFKRWAKSPCSKVRWSETSCSWTHGIVDHFSIWKVIMRWILIKTRKSQHSRSFLCMVVFFWFPFFFWCIPRNQKKPIKC